MKDIVPISKKEAEFLRENGKGHFVSRTYSRYKHYFAVEEKEILQMLDKYRASIVVK